MVDETLWQAYRDTDYCVLTTPPLVLAVDRPSPGLACLFSTHKAERAVFITAWNPFSRETSDTDNESAQQRLAARLQAQASRVLPAEGRSRRGDWRPESSFLALGIDQPTAIALGREFGQNAIVWSGPDARPRLIACA
ncbi:MAG: DUF3293 domain-containing protein [Wenzhouxiangella sp.]